ncbi:MAG: hypothetical protein U9O87_02620 [Verrucomicrobiota bacterium]|nr:hypothetical protein [Verrucomicrobiota bacterium]
MLDKKTLKSAATGDLETLANLDSRGFIMGEKESLGDFVKRLNCLKKNMEEMNKSLKAEGFFEIEGSRFSLDSQIPSKLFKTPAQKTEELYRFSIDWVPGFFVNPSFGWLFGGCAFYFFPDFFALFIIRKSFQNKERWLIYSRDELLAHELCHIARIGMKKRKFEEYFAYQTSSSSFRKAVGSVFQTAGDTYLILLSTMLLLGAQISKVFIGLPVPVWLFWIFVFLCISRLALRYRKIKKTISSATENLKKTFENNTLPVLFRCTEKEIDALSKMLKKDSVTNWVNNKMQNSIKWKIIKKRFSKRSVE